MSDVILDNMIIDLPFEPPLSIRSGHVQSLLSQFLPRRIAVRSRATSVLTHEQPLTLRANNGVRLTGYLSTDARRGRKPLVVVIHGWLGNAESTYVLSAAAALWDAGFDVARLNLRDHGNTDDLNEGMFNSARMDEVLDAVKTINVKHGSASCGVLGFSLGGNFAVRIALHASVGRVPVGAAVAVCPLIDPAECMATLDAGFYGYRLFFMRKWHRALDAKKAAFPALYDFSNTYAIRGVAALTDYFVKHHSEYATPRDYFSHYTLTGDFLRGLEVPCSVLAAQDDPIIPFAGFQRIAPQPNLRIHATRYGGHCTYVSDMSAPSFADEFAVQQFRQWQRAPLTLPAEGTARFGETATA